MASTSIFWIFVLVSLTSGHVVDRRRRAASDELQEPTYMESFSDFYKQGSWLSQFMHKKIQEAAKEPSVQTPFAEEVNLEALDTDMDVFTPAYVPNLEDGMSSGLEGSDVPSPDQSQLNERNARHTMVNFPGRQQRQPQRQQVRTPNRNGYPGLAKLQQIRQQSQAQAQRPGHPQVQSNRQEAGRYPPQFQSGYPNRGYAPSAVRAPVRSGFQYPTGWTDRVLQYVQNFRQGPRNFPYAGSLANQVLASSANFGQQYPRRQSSNSGGIPNRKPVPNRRPVPNKSSFSSTSNDQY